MVLNHHKSISCLLRWTRTLEDSFLAILLTAMIGLAGAQIVLRNFFDSGLSWADPLLRLLVLWVGLAGAMVATREDHHISIDVLIRTLPPRLKLAVRVFADLFTAVVTAVIAYHAARMVQMDREAGIIAFAEVPAWVCELIIPLAFGVIAWRYAIYTVIHSGQLLSRQGL